MDNTDLEVNDFLVHVCILTVVFHLFYRLILPCGFLAMFACIYDASISP